MIPRLLLVLVVLLPVAAQEKKKPPYRDKESALKLFAEEFVSITPGKGKFPAKFQMGSEKGPKEEQPAHEVTFKYPFGMAKFEVTQELYQALMGNNPAKWKGPRNSVEMMTHAEAVEFCKRATAEMRKAKLIDNDEEIRLPTEAEWEYCCRAGTTTPFSFGEEKEIRDFCWFRDNSRGFDPPVGEKKGNAWGLHEMHGYVCEWVADSWHPSYEKAATDGSARIEKDAKEHVIRGGGFASPADRCRSAAREAKGVDYKKDDLGFRCVKAKVK
jgi:formylglycine-generating enzyme required for sulfatase activity